VQGLDDRPRECLEAFSALNLIGESPIFREVLRTIERLAGLDAAVLIQGETGTGKELVARAIHYLGARRDGPFIPVNCGAIPDTLLENELFGHARGAFTDAAAATPGLVADADGGALFLDEVEALTPRGQVVLLRFLQDGRYRPLGSRGLLKANVRIIAASNADLREMVLRKEFRADLLYRLAIMSLDLPPLRAREGDSILLANHFVRRFNAQYHLQASLAQSSLDALDRYHWPGNVRELENFLHREVVLSEGGAIDLTARLFSGSPPQCDSTPIDDSAFERGFSAAKASLIAEFERSFLRWAMAQSNGNVSVAARRAGKERRAFGRLLKKYRIGRSAS
jgi:two-component system, NtrC family, response regulator GlrR